MERIEIQSGIERLNAQFMSPSIERGDWIEVENGNGESSFLPIADFQDHDIQDHLADLADGQSVTLTIHKNKYFARLSASGYMDCTDWTGPFDSEEEAAEYLVETYDDDRDEAPDNDDSVDLESL